MFFFFSSRRRHTRWPRDWRSDVCSSDLRRRRRPVRPGFHNVETPAYWPPTTARKYASGMNQGASTVWRSEERRVGKEDRGVVASGGACQEEGGAGGRDSDLSTDWKSSLL